MDAERKAVALFLNRLRSLAGYKDAIQCAEERPPKGQPGRAIRSRFDGFLHSFVIPEGAGLDEAIEYARLFECFVQEGAVRKDTVAVLVRPRCGVEVGRQLRGDGSLGRPTPRRHSEPGLGEGTCLCGPLTDR